VPTIIDRQQNAAAAGDVARGALVDGDGGRCVGSF
jgi:hypothetical protein